nr:hypothetical protein [Tanacetum cinerariifolium]
MVPPILAEHSELKHSLINMMTSDRFFGLEKDNPNDHIRWFNKITSTIKYKDVPNSEIKLMLFLSLSQACDHYKDLLHACPHHGFTEFHQLDTFYNALNPVDQDSLNSVAGGNLLERRTQDVLTIIKNKSKQTSVVTTAMTAILKQFQATPPPAFVKAVEEICVTFGGAHPYYQCLVTDGNTFSKFQDNIQGYISAAAVNYNQVVPLSELEKIKKMNEINMKAMQTQINNVKNELGNKIKTFIQASMSNQTNELKNMMASFFQMNTASTSGSGHLANNTIVKPKGELKAITTRSGVVLDGPSVPIPPPLINLEEDERVAETLTDQDLAEYTVKVPPPLVQKAKPPFQRNYVMLKALLSNKEKLLELENTPLNENCSAVILKKLLEKHRDPEKLLISCSFSLPELISTRMTLELANWAICALAGIARDVFVSVRKFTFLADFVIVDYERDPRVPLILGRPFLWIARALIDFHGEEMILYLFATNHLSGNPTFSSHTDLTSPKVKDDILDPEGDIVLIEKLLNLDSIKDLPPPHNINPLSGSTTFSAPGHLLEEFVDELALITFPPGNDDLLFDTESDLREIEYLLNHDLIKEMDSILKDSVYKDNLANPNEKLVDTIPEMFTDEHTLDYLSSPLYDDFDDDLDELESDNDDAYNDPFDSKEDKIKESKLLIDEHDPFRSSDFFPSPEYDSFLFEDFYEVDALPSNNNEE